MTEQVPPAAGSGWLIGRIRGVPVFVAPSWVIIALLITLMFAPNVGYDIPEIEGGKYAVSFAFAVLLYISVLIHELGHAFTALRFGLGVKRITLQLTVEHDQLRRVGRDTRHRVVGARRALDGTRGA